MTLLSKASEDLTGLLDAWSRGDRNAEGALFPIVYGELRRIAGGFLRAERPGHTLEPTALVHEAYLRLACQRRLRWEDRDHFFSFAARLMRRVLIDHARTRGRAKRGGGVAPLAIEAAASVAAGRGNSDPTPAVEEALRRLAAADPIKASVVEMRFFGGLTVEEVATALDCSPTTVARHWRMARAWLSQELRQGGAGAS